MATRISNSTVCDQKDIMNRAVRVMNPSLHFACSVASLSGERADRLFILTAQIKNKQHFFVGSKKQECKLSINELQWIIVVHRRNYLRLGTFSTWRKLEDLRYFKNVGTRCWRIIEEKEGEWDANVQFMSGAYPYLTFERYLASRCWRTWK